jgi:predicted ATPase/DNA-binding SARP family transcriptional activator
MDRHWRIDLLGGLRAVEGGRVITRFPTQKAAALLAYLALTHSVGGGARRGARSRGHPRSLSREALIELLWPEHDPEAARNNLRVALHALRRQFELPDSPTDCLLLSDRSTISLNPAAFSTDVTEFEAAVEAAGEVADPGPRVAHLRRAAELYQGELLPGFHEPWVFTERQQLAEVYLESLHQLTAALEQAGDLEQALEYAHRAVSADPLQEEAHYDLMRLYAAAGQPSATLRQYLELERILREELGEAPSPATRALAEELRQDARTVVVTRSMPPVDAPPPPPAAPESTLSPPPPPTPVAEPLAPPPAPPTPRLPAQFTRFFGREEGIAWLTETLPVPETRLVTLTGPGGSGKTRLAVAVAGRLQAEFNGAIWFVPLADLAEARLLPDAIVIALGLPRQGLVDPLEQVVESLQVGAASDERARSGNGSPGSALLVLDNFEQLVEEGAPLVRHLLERVPNLTCLVTSRQRLELAGELEYIVLPLPTPGVGRRVSGVGLEPSVPDTRHPIPDTLMQYPGVALFVDRARAARPGFQLTAENAGAVAALCDRLEGLPLAIELAAARADVLTPQQMLARLERRFELLVSHQRDLSARHRSLRAAIEWSYQLLAPALRQFFARLSIFRGGWTLEAAEAVCGEPQGLEYLEQLRECSLVVAEESGGEMRYRLLESLREFAAEQLEREERAGRASDEPAHDGRAQERTDAAGELARRHAEFFLQLAEQAIAASSGAERDLWLERLERDHDNLRGALEWSQTAGGDRELGLALGAALGWFWQSHGYLTEGRERLAALLAGYEADGTFDRMDAKTRVRVLAYAGRLTCLQGDHETARPFHEESLSLARSLDDPALIADSLCDLAVVQRDPPVKRSLYEEGLAIYRELGDARSVAGVLVSLGMTASWHDLVGARALHQEGLAVFRQLGDKTGIAWTLAHLGNLTYYQGDYAAFRAHAEESLPLFRFAGDRMGIACSFNQLGTMALVEGRAEEAAGLHEQSLQIAQELGSQSDIAGTLTCLGDVAVVQGDRRTAAARYEQALGIARAHDDWERTIWALLGLGRVAEQQEEAERAAAFYAESLALGQEQDHRISVLASLEGLARVAAVSGQEERGARLLGAAATHREALGVPLPPHLRPGNERTVAAVRAALGEAAFAAAWTEGRAITLEQAVADALQQKSYP